ncbi:glutamate--tRNA ligase family protein [Flavihumibacter sp. CACIAM 22H1]|uniref:glutamate--tRNA ligase family protein n=1 Tax=Flavihumibacter sp. CACIAM 22H1 TaxID=1812911 RepID=UPI0007A81A40|nr:glutamate--tRNA ligase family protein [Flavihumibacter sp. CACIAM 22H1]KYP16030.1 MAG: hypothetical protein A1D16_18305 [Flavihumibacter sp. CACIAM 22H1]
MLPEAFHRTRYAPTPSGYLHLGNLYSFILTAILARDKKLEILLRIDDLDRERFRPAYLRNIFAVLHYFDLPWQQGPEDEQDFEKNWSQLTRMALYKKALQQLRTSGYLYACSCSRSDQQQNKLETGCVKGCRDAALDFDGPGVNWRFRTPEDPAFPIAMKDFIVRKKDGSPAYQLCSVIDDLHLKVGWIVRGRDLVNSSIAQLALSNALEVPDYSQIMHFHHALLLGNSGNKLSKSAGSDSLQSMIQNGLSAEDILSLLARQLGIHRRISHWSAFDWDELTINL